MQRLPKLARYGWFFEGFFLLSPKKAFQSKFALNTMKLILGGRSNMGAALPLAISDLRFATCDLRLVICLLQFATCDLPLSICRLRFATFDLPLVICHLRFATRDLPLAISFVSREPLES
jgi:hypothetical protein